MKTVVMSYSYTAIELWQAYCRGVKSGTHQDTELRNVHSAP